MTSAATKRPRIAQIAPISREALWSAALLRRFSPSRGLAVSPFQRFNHSTLQLRAGFTLLELLIVVGIIGLLLVLIAPAFTYIKGGTDVTSAAYTIKGVLDTARTYAKANNTYTWVGFIEENTANPASPNSSPPPIGRVIMSIVASKDGTTVYDPNSLATIDPTKLIPGRKADEDRQSASMDPYRHPKRDRLNV